MMNAKNGKKQVFTTGEAAEICMVSQQCIIRRFDEGRLEGFRVPGSKFRRIPRQKLIRFMRENDIPPERLNSGRMKVLIVDDDQEVDELIREALGSERFEFETVSSDFEAGMAIGSFQPELILLDYTLHHVNAELVCRSIRGNPELEQTRIIIMSGLLKEDKVKKILKSGANCFLKKPLDPKGLNIKVAKVLELEEEPA